MHLALGAVPFYLAYVLVRTRAPWPVVGAAVGVALAAAAGVLVWLFTIDGSIGEGERSLRQVGRFSADWLDFVVRHDRHGSESFVFLGWLTPLVAIAGLVILVRRRSYGLAGLFGAATLVPVVLALGTTTPIYEAVRFVIWPLRNLRVPERLMPIACLAIAALVAYAVDELRQGQAATPCSAPGDRRSRARRRPPARRPPRDDVRGRRRPTRGTTRTRRWRRPARPRPRGARLPAGHPLRRRLSLLRHAGPAGTAAGLLDARAGGGGRAREGARGDQLRRLDTAGRARCSARLGVTSVVFHEGLFRDNPAAPDTAAFAWEALARHGFRPQAEDGPVTLLARRGGGPAPPAPVDEPAT